MANAQQDDLDFIINHYEQCGVDFQCAMFRYRELLFFRKSATEKSKIMTIQRKANAHAKVAPEARRRKAAPTSVENKTAFMPEEPGPKVKTPSARSAAEIPILLRTGFQHRTSL